MAESLGEQTAVILGAAGSDCRRGVEVRVEIEEAQGMRDRGTPSREAAHFLMKLMFCMFPEDIDLLPARLFPKLLSNTRNDPAKLASRLRSLFQAMAWGGDFGEEAIQHFNDGLLAEADLIELTPAEFEEQTRVSGYDGSSVEPTIFGTLLERTLDPAKRSQIGAHSTSRDDILTLLEPVLMALLRGEWQAVEEKCEKLWVEVQEGTREAPGPVLSVFGFLRFSLFSIKPELGFCTEWRRFFS